jgi:hypothetical protein
MCAAGACTGGAEPLILNIICILRERDGHGMTTFIMGHGQYKGPDTFVPIGDLSRHECWYGGIGAGGRLQISL